MSSERVLAGELSSSFLRLYSIPLGEVRYCSLFKRPDIDKTILLHSIPEPPEPSYRPLHLLYVFLSELTGPWPSFDLVKAHTRLVAYLPEETKNGNHGEFKWLVKATDRLVKNSYSGIAEFIGNEDRPALWTTNPQSYITHQGLSNYVAGFQLPTDTRSKKPTVAIALPNGPLLAATTIAVTTYYIAAPINPAAGPDQFRADIRQSGASFILTTSDDCTKLKLRDWAPADQIEVLFVDWDGKDEILLQRTSGELNLSVDTRPDPNTADNIGLVLFTSGTSGTKKVVPLTIHSIIVGIVFVIESWGLTKTDVCLNMMPLYHVGGLIRNIYAPIFSSGATICCAVFDPNMFWDVVEELHPTWYYASPSMHSLILAEAQSRPRSLSKSRIRLVCNAAGSLLPSLACKLRDTFGCAVLPSYGMTECMPISTPPLDYKLDREGTSGTRTGPELTILDWSESKMLSGSVGRVCVRGEPVFSGYLRPDGTMDRSPFNDGGWFDTGDMGYMDDDGYLYITGRSKEVINRGGELISPFEVENAILSAAMSENTSISGRVSQVLAFSVSHGILQEVVAVALVTPPDVPRVDLRTLHTSLRSCLQQAKWPVLIVYMDDLPKKNNKLLRINLGQRLGIPAVTDQTSHLSRHWEATCPPPDTALPEPIACSQCTIDHQAVTKSLGEILPAEIKHYYRKDLMDSTICLSIAPTKSNQSQIEPLLADVIKTRMSLSTHNYMIPDQIHVMPRPFDTDCDGNVDETRLREAILEMKNTAMERLGVSIEGQVTRAFSEILACEPDQIPLDVDFFTLGGDSLRAGRLLSLLRTTFKLPFSVDLIFNHGNVQSITAHIREISDTTEAEDHGDLSRFTETRSSTNPFLMLLHLFPLAVFYPMRRATQWTIFLVALGYTGDWRTTQSLPGRLLNLTLAILFAQVVVTGLAPFVGILAKWLIIGRYREGLYPMWGWYHTRWWLAEKIVAICGPGYFESCDASLRLYYRLMGARIGKGAILTGSSLGEYDLLDIRDGVVLSQCICRPFAAEHNASMYLGRIVIGENSFVGKASIVSAGSEIPPNTCIGANSSSWELGDADESNRDLDLETGPQPHWLLVGLFTLPLKIMTHFMSLLPWFAGLVGMVMDQPSDSSMSVRAILKWFTEPERISYHYLALILRSFFAPFILFAFVLAVKVILDSIFGKLKPGPTHERGAVATWRADLIRTLLPVARLHELTNMFGQHYEATSVAIRMLGGKIGRRVYWSGTGPSMEDYHLLDIGNDVVFGSRAHLITSDALGSEKITIRDQAMIADRCCLLPGVEIGERTTMGSGALTRRNKRYAADGTYVGSKSGDAVCLSTGSDNAQGKIRPKSTYQSHGSESTLAEAEKTKKGTSKKQVRHMSSDDTLTENRKAPKKQPSQVGATSDSEVEEKPAAPGSAVSPFGRAFYLNMAPYRVFGQFSIFCYSAFLTVFTAFYWNVPNISGVQVANMIIHRFLPTRINLWLDILAIYLLMWVSIAILTTLQAILALSLVVASKWILMGRRAPGNYDWDKSSYCQRWQIFLAIERLRRHCYLGQGVLSMITGTHWIVLYLRAMGAQIGKDCALFASGRPSLVITEPDLIRLGDRVVMDDASVVAHINTRGKFDLNRLEVGDRCVLRTGSRLLSGATMKEDSCLLEHTLIMGGDVVEAGWTMQGWPAERFKGKRVKLQSDIEGEA